MKNLYIFSLFPMSVSLQDQNLNKLTDLSDPTRHPDLASQQPPTHTPTHTSVEDAQLVQVHHQTHPQDAAKS